VGAILHHAWLFRNHTHKHQAGGFAKIYRGDGFAITPIYFGVYPT